MEQYLRKTRLGTAVDAFGGHFALFFCCILAFALLWGMRLSALLAGCAAFVMTVLVRARTHTRRLERREERLRRRLGGEMKLEAWVTKPSHQAHKEVALLLSSVYPLTMVKVLETGTICTLHEERILIVCAQLPVGEKASARDIASLQRVCTRHGLMRAVLCGAEGWTEKAQRQAEYTPKVTLLERERIIALAGAVWPASDAQLVELGRRKRAQRQTISWRERVLDVRRAENYLLYGLMLVGLYLLTGQAVYPLPGIVSLVLMAACRVHSVRRREKIPAL